MDRIVGFTTDKGGALCFWAHFSDRTFGDFLIGIPGIPESPEASSGSGQAVEVRLDRGDGIPKACAELVSVTVSRRLAVGICTLKGGGLMVSSPICLSIFFELW